MDDEETQTTYYGYEEPGDPDFDWNSYQGIGDRDNQLVDNYSVALTQAERLARFGVSGKSTGQEFDYQGQIRRDDDTAPESNRRVDIYSRGGPGEGTRYVPHTEEEYQKMYSEDDPNLNQPPEEEQPPKEQDPPVKDVLAPDFMLQQIRKQTPAYANLPDAQVLEAFQKKNPTPLTQLRSLFPQYDEIPDDQFTESVRAKFYPDLNGDDFKDRINPPTGIEGAYKNAVKQFWPHIAQSWHQGMANIAKFPERADEGLNWLEGQKWIGDLMGQQPKDDPDDPFRNGIKRLYDAGQKQAKKAANVKTTPAQGVAGHTAAILGDMVGSAPEAVLSFMPGIGPAASLTLGMTYNAVTAAGNAKEAGKDDGLAQGFLAGGVRAVQGWILNTPRGRLLTGVYNAALGIGDEQAQKWMNGDKDNDLDKTAALGAVDFVLGAIIARGREKLPVAAKEEVAKAEQARDSGDIEGAKQLLDRSQLFLKDTDRAEVGQLLLKWRDDVIPMPDSPDIKTPPKFEKEMTDQFYYSGLPIGHMADFIVSELPKAREAVSKATKPYTDIWHTAWDPENISEVHQRAGSIISEQNAAFADKRQRLMNAYIAKMKLGDTMRFAEDPIKRTAFWDTKTDGQLKSFAEAADEGRSTGDPIVDRMIKINKGGYSAISKMEESYGLTYPLRESYIYRVLKRPEDISKVEDIIKRNRWGDPRFLHPREVEKLSTLHKYGIEMKTYNQEKIFQMRLDDSLRAISRVQALRDMASDGLAVGAKDLKGTPSGLQSQIMAQSSDVRSPNGEHYWVHKDADFMLHRAWDPSMVRGTAVDKFFLQPLRYIKQKTVGTRLGLSGFHHLHTLDILSANLLTTAQRRFLEGTGTGTGKDLVNAMTDVLSGGIKEQVKAVKGYARLLNFYQGKGVHFDDLSPEEKWQFHYQQMGGLAPIISHEREQQFMGMINKHVPGAAKLEPAVNFGYKFLTAAPYQQWLFKQVIPSIKMAAFDAEAKALFDAKPWLMNPRAEGDLRVQLRRIGKLVDSRFGEMNYDNLFWPKISKILGQNLMLSLGWKLGFWRIYAGGVHSLMSSAAHMDEIIKTYREEGMKPVAQRVLTNELLYMMNYTALTGTKALIASAIIGGGGAAALTIMDALYPRIGKNPNGTDKRIKPPYFTAELGALHEMWKNKGPAAGLQYLQNATQPALSTIFQLFNNKDYRGTEIHGKYDPLINQIGETAAFVLTQSLPFSVEAAVRAKPGATWTDKLLPFFGLPPAPAWTGRTDVENRIINQFAQRQGDKMRTKDAQDQIDARTAYREALLSKDQNAIQQARAEMVKLGMSQRSIDDADKTKDKTTGERIFPMLSSEDQRGLLKTMTPDERVKYLPFAHKDVRSTFNQ